MTIKFFTYVFLFFLVFSLPSSGEARDQSFGNFSGSVKAEWQEDGRSMKLLENFEFIDPNGLTWLAPKESVVDGASIPRFLWTLVGSPFSGEYRDASVIHDVACAEKKRTWEVVHLAFYYAMLASGVGEAKSKIMYGAVYHFGPRWPIKQKVLVRKAGTYDVFVGYENPCPPGWHCFDEGNPIYEKRYLSDLYEERLVPAPKSTLKQENFETLISEIENAEKTGNPIALEKIRGFDK